MTRAARIEGRVQIGIMLLMGGGAGAASFKHIHDLALAYGQPSWIGWANAVVVELMSIVAGLEIRRRKRTGQSARFVYLVFFGAVLISLAANVAKAHPSPWGWIMAALPALGFLAVVKIVLTRQPIETEPDRFGADQNTGPAQALDRTRVLDTRILDGTRADALPTGPAEQPDRTLAVAGPDRTVADQNTGPVGRADRSTDLYLRKSQATTVDQSDPASAGRIWTETTGGPSRLGDLDRSIVDRVVPVQRVNGHHAGSSTAGPTDDERRWSGSDLPGTRTGPDRARPDADLSGPDRVRTGLDDDLLELGKTAAVMLAMRKVKLTRETLIKEIRDSGRTIGTDRANDLLRWLKEDEAASVGTN